MFKVCQELLKNHTVEKPLKSELGIEMLGIAVCPSISNTIKENPKPSRHISSYNFAWIPKYYSFLESSDQCPEHSAAGFPVFWFKSVQEPVFSMYCATLSSGPLCATSPHKASHRAASNKEGRNISNFTIKVSSLPTPWVKSWTKRHTSAPNVTIASLHQMT